MENNHFYLNGKKIIDGKSKINLIDCKSVLGDCSQMITNELNRMTTVSKNRLLTFFCLMHDSNYGNPMNGYDGIFIDLI